MPASPQISPCRTGRRPAAGLSLESPQISPCGAGHRPAAGLSLESPQTSPRRARHRPAAGLSLESALTVPCSLHGGAIALQGNGAPPDSPLAEVQSRAEVVGERHAWWRNWRVWPGSEPSQVPDSPKRGRKGRTSRTEASEHVVWARRVRSEQQERFRPAFESATRARSSVPSPPRAVETFCPAVPKTGKHWAEMLRGGESMTQPLDWQERKKSRLKRDRALQRLQGMQLKWRQEQAAEKARAPSRPAASCSSASCASALASSTFSMGPESVKGSSGHRDSNWSAGTTRCSGPATSSGASAAESSLIQAHASGRLPSGSCSEGGSSASRSRSDGSNSLSRSYHSSRSRRSGSSTSHDAYLTTAVGKPPSLQGFERQLDLRDWSRVTSQRSSVSEGQEAIFRTHFGDFAEGGMGPFVAGSYTPTFVETSTCNSTRTSNRSSGGSCRRSAGDMDVREEVCAAPIIIEEEPTPHDELSVRRARKLSDVWADARAVFDLEVLDSLASFFQPSLDAVELGRLSSELGFPGAALLEAASKLGYATSDTDTTASFRSFTEFLSAVCLADDLVERANPRRCWTHDQLLQAELRFNARVQGQASWALPTTQLFHFFAELDCNVLNAAVSSPQEQRAMLDLLVDAGALPPGQSFLTFDKAVASMTLVRRGKERDARRTAYQLELAAADATGLNELELEDLRELHNKFTAFPAARVGDVSEATRQLQLLLRDCGVASLTPMEARSISDLIRAMPPCASPVSFGQFVHWMAQVLRLLNQSKKLTWHCSGGICDSDLEGRTGFTAAMARERLRFDRGSVEPATQSLDVLAMALLARRDAPECSVRGRSPEAAGRNEFSASSSDLDSKAQSRSKRSGTRHKTLPSRPGTAKRRGGADRRAATGKWGVALSIATASGLSTDAATGTQADELPQMECGADCGSPPKGPPSRGNSSTPKSRRGHCAFRLPQMSGTERQSSSGRGPADHADPGEITTGVIRLKGLPPSEAMLSRKQFRANSVDLTDHPPLLSSATMDAEGAVPMALACSLDAHRGSSSLGGPLQRKVKPALDSTTLVQSAITKLTQAHLADSDEDGA